MVNFKLNAIVACLMMGAASPVLASPYSDCRDGNAYLEPDRQFIACDAALRAVSDKKQEAFLRFKRAEAFYWQELISQSLADLNIAIATDPKLVDAYVRRAWVYSRLRQWEEARRDVEAALTEQQRNAQALFALSYVYSNTERNSARAYAALKQALEIDPNLHLARLNFAYDQYYYRGDVEAMLKEFQTLLSHDEAELDKVSYQRSERGVLFAAHVRHERARHLLLAGRDDEALSDAEWLISRHPTMSSAFLLRGRVLRNKNNVIEAVKDFGRAIDLDPYNVDAKRERGWALVAMERYDDALTDANGIIQGTWAQSEGYRLRAEIAKRQGDREQSLRDYEEAFRGDPRLLRIMQERLVGLGYLSRHYGGAYSEETRNGMMACIVDPGC